MVKPIPADRLARRCDPSAFEFATTADLPELDEIVGQDRAVEAVAFGIAIRQPGYNLYAMGPEGIGKYSLVRQFLLDRARAEPVPDDWCYVHDFGDPRRPRALRLPAGEGHRLKERIGNLDRELRAAIPAAFESEEYRNRRQALETALKDRREGALLDFERRAAGRGIGLLRTPVGVGLAALRDGKVLERDDIAKLPAAERQRLATATEELEDELGELVQRTFPSWERETRAAIRQTGEAVTKRAVGHLIDDVRRHYRDHAAVLAHLEALEKDVVANAEEFLAAAQPRELPSLLAARLEDGAVFRRYQVNLLVDNAETAGAPVVFEDLPTQPNLLGRVEHTAQLGALVTDFTLIRPGALHRANGGYLVLDARRLLVQPFAWEELKRALRAGVVRIEPLGDRLGLATVSLEPEPIPLATKVVLVGDRQVYYLLAELDPDFLELFKVQVDFEEDVPRRPATEQQYARLMGTIAARAGMPPLEPGAVAAILDHASRLAGDAERLSTHMRRLTDVLREAADRSTKAGQDRVTAADIAGAIEAQRRRASRIHERSLEDIARGTMLVATSGEVVGVANGLSVVPLGEVAFGRPSRITASVRLGDGEVVDIEREVNLGGPIHSKGVLILSGFLGGRYGRSRPLTVQASLVFEQSYGGVEGDSATLAETCALLSAIGEVPLRQSIAVTGSLNQQGGVQPVGGVNEKVEGFFDVCAARGLDGTHGVIVPAANLPHLMLREDVVAAARGGRFSVWAVSTVDEALALLTGLPAGERADGGAYPPGSVNGRVEAGLVALAERAREFAVLQPVPAPKASPTRAGARARARRRTPAK
ncbi:MAG: ATP-dependent protease [Chloroflexi bacterium RBG_16_72_14]|nr:MAG: ATP-dependent protease [Chloroflexi bacterium RBG_16_72_14]